MDRQLAITIEGLSKRYRIGEYGGALPYRTLREAWARAALTLFARVRRPRATSAPAQASPGEFWALREIELEVKRGESVAIIGRNGAGKSTLLRILSRITAPTEGRVCIRGRVASLLEVGTGFHPELSGRDNIFLNGAILGMTRAEIQARFDAIVAFAGIEPFLDTPIKHFSSGMYVRLAFSIAAHVEPDVLVVDEVLAVGDAEFQQKSIGQMQDVSRGGRSVLFVSHNIAAIQALTTRAIVLERGRSVFVGPTAAAIDFYTRMTPAESKAARAWGKGVHTQLRAARLLDAAGNTTRIHQAGAPLRVEIEFHTDGSRGLSLQLSLCDLAGAPIGSCSLHHFHGGSLPTEAGTYRVRFELAPLPLATGPYSFDVASEVINLGWDHHVAKAIEFEVPFCNPNGGSFDYRQEQGFGALALLAQNPLLFQAIEPAPGRASDT